MTLSKTLFLFLSYILLMMLPNKAHSQPADTTDFSIDSFNPTSDDLKYERDAFVPWGSTHLSLIATNASGNPRTSSVGRVLYPNPIKLWDEGRHASFMVAIQFFIGQVDTDPADGMTFFIVPVNSTTPMGGEGGSLGIFNAVKAGSPIFAVEFDTYVNSAIDPDYRHVGIDINSKVSVETANFENSIGKTVTAYINYDGPTRTIAVRTLCATQISKVSYVYDLKALLPEQVQIGLSASTGPYHVASFDVFKWVFHSAMVDDNYNALDEDTHIKQYVA